MTNKQFKIDLTLECDPSLIEFFMERFAQLAEDDGGTITQYRYFVPQDEQQS